jgi:hypothetical protein
MSFGNGGLSEESGLYDKAGLYGQAGLYVPGSFSILGLQPAGAYSLRSFDADANPNVVNVRRSSGGPPRDFKASEVSDGTLADWVGPGNDGYVTTWYDQSENGNNTTQSTASQQPKIVDGGTLVTEGGRPALDFDGTDDHLAKIATFTINGDHMILAVHANEIAGGYMFSLGYNDLESVLLWSNSTNYSRYWLNSSGDRLESGEGVAGQRLTTGEMSIGSQTLYINGTQNDTKSTAYSGGDVPDITIGYAVERAQGANYFNGKVQELIFFNGDQSNNRTVIENNINDHYAIYS